MVAQTKEGSRTVDWRYWVAFGGFGAGDEAGDACEQDDRRLRERETGRAGRKMERFL